MCKIRVTIRSMKSIKVHTSYDLCIAARVELVRPLGTPVEYGGHLRSSQHVICSPLLHRPFAWSTREDRERGDAAEGLDVPSDCGIARKSLDRAATTASATTASSSRWMTPPQLSSSNCPQPSGNCSPPPCKQSITALVIRWIHSFTPSFKVSMRLRMAFGSYRQSSVKVRMDTIYSLPMPSTAIIVCTESSQIRSPILLRTGSKIEMVDNSAF